MSKKNSPEAKAQRRDAKRYDRGYPAYYTEVKTKYGSKLVRSDKMKQPVVMTMATLFYGRVLERLGLLEVEVADA